jgi:hypothetical protein
VTREVGERLAVLEVSQEHLEKAATTIANNVIKMQGEANADRELMRETLRVVAATHQKLERVLEQSQATNRHAEKIAGDNETYLKQIHAAVGAAKDFAGKAADAAEDAADKADDAAQAAARAADATGRIPLVPMPIPTLAPTEKSGSVAKVTKIVFSAPVAKILAVSVLVIALAVGAAGAIVVLQEVRAIKARLGGEK